MITSYNDLVYAIAQRLRQLGEYKMNVLRSTAGFGCNSQTEAIRLNAHKSRGILLEEIITEEFCLENDVPFETC